MFGSIYARAFKRLGLTVVRGSSGKDFHRSGGYRGLRELLRALKENKSVALTVEVPGNARIAGPGVIAIARLSGRPIVPLAVVGSRRFSLPWRWDKPTITLPFGRLVVAQGSPIFVSGNDDCEYVEQKRKELDAALTRLNSDAAASADL
jgi:lysophospholipid acyltransferase (LPLAT)-like uncharacterized protein